jgi:asparagine synthase (glutamine-hydrolysing)
MEDMLERAARNREHFWGGCVTFWENMKTALVNRSAMAAASRPEELLRSGLLPEGYRDADSFNVIRSFLGPFDERFPGQDELTRMTYVEFKLRLNELLLMRVDKMTMANSVEARVPFLDHRLVEFTMDIPERAKTRNGVAKYLLKKAVENLIPNEIIYRKKMGFGAPMSEWLRGPFGGHVASLISKSPLMERGFLRLAPIMDMVKEHRTCRKRDHAQKIWAIFNLVGWYNRWIERAG